MNPEQLAKSNTEHAHQRALFAWAAMAQNFGFMAANDMPSYESKQRAEQWGGPGESELRWLHAIPNGGLRDKVTAAKLKAEGVKPGVSDCFLPVRRAHSCGLYIEMKRPGEMPSAVQIEFGEFVLDQGFVWVVCDHWRKAADILEHYITGRIKERRN